VKALRVQIVVIDAATAAEKASGFKHAGAQVKKSGNEDSAARKRNQVTNFIRSQQLAP